MPGSVASQRHIKFHLSRVSNRRQAARQVVLSRGLALTAKRQRPLEGVRLFRFVKATPIPKTDPLVSAEFQRLAQQWKEDTALVSSITEKAMHPAYQQIIGLGKEALPLIFGEMKRAEPDHWFWALRAITGIDPVKPEVRGDVRGMTDSWLSWADSHGYLYGHQ